jgi:hypothetical protein
LVVVFLLLSATSLARYLFSQWSSIRNSNRGIGWVATSIGITLLLAAASIVVLAVGLLPKLGLLPGIESEPIRTSAQPGSGAAEEVRDREETSAATSRSRARTERDVSPASGRSDAHGYSEHRGGIEMASALSSQPSRASLEAKRDAATSDSAGLIFTAADPWAATNCVVAFNPDPADLTRWRIENECGGPVGLVFASCSTSPSECSSRASVSWEYRTDGMILPGKAQRSVTDEEDTQYGSQIRYVACMLAAPLTIKLIGQNSETRSSPEWLVQFDEARNSDECLALVRKWTDAGRGSGRSIDALLGGNAPGKVHPGATTEP